MCITSDTSPAKSTGSDCVLEFFVLYGDVWWLHEVFARDDPCQETLSVGHVQQAAVEEINFIQMQFPGHKYIQYDKATFVEKRGILGRVLHCIFGGYGYVISCTLKNMDKYLLCYKIGTSGIGVFLLVWTIYGIVHSVPEPRDLGTFDMVEHSPVFKIILLACTHAIIVVFARAQQDTLKRKVLRGMDSARNAVLPNPLKEEAEHLQYPCLLPFIVGKFFLIARMVLAYSNHDLGIAMDYFVIQEAILITVHAFIAMFGVPLMEKWFQGEFGVSFMKKMQARFWSVLIADSLKTGIMFIFYFGIFTPGPISRCFNRLPDQYTQIAVAVFVHGVLDAMQTLVTFFMFYIGEIGRRFMGFGKTNSLVSETNSLLNETSVSEHDDRFQTVPDCA